jgi:hypothetical protein
VRRSPYSEGLRHKACSFNLNYYIDPKIFDQAKISLIGDAGNSLEIAHKFRCIKVTKQAFNSVVFRVNTLFSALLTIAKN